MKKARRIPIDLKPQGGLVGVFWYFRRRLLSVSAPLSLGVLSSVSIDAPFDHVAEWPSFQQRHPNLATFSYEQIPRGRVLFLKIEKRFVVYLDRVLVVTTVKRAIRKEFKLPAKGTRFVTDGHYTTDAAALDRLFEAD